MIEGTAARLLMLTSMRSVRRFFRRELLEVDGGRDADGERQRKRDQQREERTGQRAQYARLLGFPGIAAREEIAVEAALDPAGGRQLVEPRDLLVGDAAAVLRQRAVYPAFGEQVGLVVGQRVERHRAAPDQRRVGGDLRAQIVGGAGTDEFAQGLSLAPRARLGKQRQQRAVDEGAVVGALERLLRERPRGVVSGEVLRRKDDVEAEERLREGAVPGHDERREQQHHERQAEHDRRKPGSPKASFRAVAARQAGAHLGQGRRLGLIRTVHGSGARSVAR